MEKCLKEKSEKWPSPLLPAPYHSVNDVIMKPEEYIEAIRREAKSLEMNEYSPEIDVVA